MAKPEPFRELVGSSAAIVAVRALALRASQVAAPVLIEGETGTGKSLLARLIHQAGARSRGPFVPVNCAGVPDGLFESEFFGHEEGAFTGASRPRRGFFQLADGGTLLLDEVGELPLGQQPKLLLALDDGEIRRVGGDRALRVRPRLLSATSSPLHSALRTGAFRRDLYYRLSVLRIRLPTLRERVEDLPELARSLAAAVGRRHLAKEVTVGPRALSALEDEEWPGNVRQLQHVLEVAVVLGGSGVIDHGRLAEAISVSGVA